MTMYECAASCLQVRRRTQGGLEDLEVAVLCQVPDIYVPNKGSSCYQGLHVTDRCTVMPTNPAGNCWRTCPAICIGLSSATEVSKDVIQSATMTGQTANIALCNIAHEHSPTSRQQHNCAVCVSPAGLGDNSSIANSCLSQF